MRVYHEVLGLDVAVVVAFLFEVAGDRGEELDEVPNLRLGVFLSLLGRLRQVFSDLYLFF